MRTINRDNVQNIKNRLVNELYLRYNRMMIELVIFDIVVTNIVVNENMCRKQFIVVWISLLQYISYLESINKLIFSSTARSLSNAVQTLNLVNFKYHIIVITNLFLLHIIINE